MTKDESIKSYVEKALAMGAVDAVPFSVEDIAFDPRVRLKCLYGCSTWGHCHTCPSRPYYPTLAEFHDMFSRYEWGLMIHTHERGLGQEIALAIEGRAFADGYYFAFALAPGECMYCKTCAAEENKPCRIPKKARPPIYSVGIDVFQTVRNLGLPIQTLWDAEHDEQNRYAAVFIK